MLDTLHGLEGQGTSRDPAGKKGVVDRNFGTPRGTPSFLIDGNTGWKIDGNAREFDGTVTI